MEYGLWQDYVIDKNYIVLIVLILVLMEYGLWRKTFLAECFGKAVLILVLMEYGLWHQGESFSGKLFFVLILVLMEYGLWQSTGCDETTSAES